MTNVAPRIVRGTTSGMREIDNKGSIQRGLIYTEKKPLGRLCKMCNPFCYEFQVVPSVNFFKLVRCTGSTYTTDAEGERVDPDWLLDQLNRRRGGGGAMICFVMEACKGRLHGCSGRGS